MSKAELIEKASELHKQIAEFVSPLWAAGFSDEIRELTTAANVINTIITRLKEETNLEQEAEIDAQLDAYNEIYQKALIANSPSSRIALAKQRLANVIAEPIEVEDLELELFPLLNDSFTKNYNLLNTINTQSKTLLTGLMQSPDTYIRQAEMLESAQFVLKTTVERIREEHEATIQQYKGYQNDLLKFDALLTLTTLGDASLETLFGSHFKTSLNEFKKHVDTLKEQTNIKNLNTQMHTALNTWYEELQQNILNLQNTIEDDKKIFNETYQERIAISPSERIYKLQQEFEANNASPLENAKDIVHLYQKISSLRQQILNTEPEFEALKHKLDTIREKIKAQTQTVIIKLNKLGEVLSEKDKPLVEDLANKITSQIKRTNASTPTHLYALKTELDICTENIEVPLAQLEEILDVYDHAALFVKTHKGNEVDAFESIDRIISHLIKNKEQNERLLTIMIAILNTQKSAPVESAFIRLISENIHKYHSSTIEVIHKYLQLIKPTIKNKKDIELLIKKCSIIKLYIEKNVPLTEEEKSTLSDTFFNVLDQLNKTSTINALLDGELLNQLKNTDLNEALNILIKSKITITKEILETLQTNPEKCKTITFLGQNDSNTNEFITNILEDNTKAPTVMTALMDSCESVCKQYSPLTIWLFIKKYPALQNILDCEKEKLSERLFFLEPLLEEINTKADASDLSLHKATHAAINNSSRTHEPIINALHQFIGSNNANAQEFQRTYQLFQALSKEIKKYKETNNVSTYHQQKMQVFIRDALPIILDKMPLEQKQEPLKDLAKKCFPHKHEGVRILLDLLQIITVVFALIIMPTRHFLGKSPFFSQTKTKTREDAEQLIQTEFNKQKEVSAQEKSEEPKASGTTP